MNDIKDKAKKELIEAKLMLDGCAANILKDCYVMIHESKDIESIRVTRGIPLNRYYVESLCKNCEVYSELLKKYNDDIAKAREEGVIDERY